MKDINKVKLKVTDVNEVYNSLTRLGYKIKNPKSTKQLATAISHFKGIPLNDTYQGHRKTIHKYLTELNKYGKPVSKDDSIFPINTMEELIKAISKLT